MEMSKPGANRFNILKRGRGAKPVLFARVLRRRERRRKQAVASKGRKRLSQKAVEVTRPAH